MGNSEMKSIKYMTRRHPRILPVVINMNEDYSKVSQKGEKFIKSLEQWRKFFEVVMKREISNKRIKEGNLKRYKKVI